MSAVRWDEIDQRLYETGVDRGVLYPSDSPGVAWNGLTGIDEDLSGEGATPVYFDGVKVSDNQAFDDFLARLSAFTFPDEFLEMIGLHDLGFGVFVDNQRVKTFGLSYRTLIGNAVEGTDLGYKIHLTYNLTAIQEPHPYLSLSDSQSSIDMGWSIAGAPELAPGYRPTAHVIFDTTLLDPEFLESLELILYGDETTDPRLPPLSELINYGTYGSRFVIVIAEPDLDLLPANVRDGDVIFAISDETVYEYSGPASDEVRSTFVISTGDPIPPDALPGDLIYDEDTGVLYKLGA
jgi:hypothetical protein